jgi:hypothetical protein
MTNREEAARAALEAVYREAQFALADRAWQVDRTFRQRDVVSAALITLRATILADIEERKRLREAAQSVAWSVILADHVGDVWGPMERLLEAAGLPAPIEDDEGCYVLPFPIDPRFPDDEAERYALARRALRGSDTEPKVSLWKGKA